MNGHELDAAGITDPLLREAYALCEALCGGSDHTAHALMRSQLAVDRQPYWDAMIAFCGHADDLADAPGVPLAERRRAYDAFVRLFFRLLDTGPGTRFRTPRRSGSRREAARRQEFLIALAFADFVQSWRLSLADVREASEALRRDMEYTEYGTVAALERYMRGVSGHPARWLTLLLGPREGTPEPDALRAAESWGLGLQTLDFLTDVEEDLALGKLYLPLVDLQRCGLSRLDVERAVADRRATLPLRRLAECQARRAREYFGSATRWIERAQPRGWEPVRNSIARSQEALDGFARCEHDLFALPAGHG
ncbi:hypothetical protein E0L36_05620 [Streptomyces sp. AJS327]|uniref:squalene/phytoene synthase family protein n=1 Tax=Streptomyces sp. AJS327 TaxID=2545265 RepID=UPI0015DF3BD7|nr:squalene/phytoene synthase family protein [Streptomyces sp. AJS327]MBA0050392.1 hypothetical protein [Streptomyces sp. AJS327]